MPLLPNQPAIANLNQGAKRLPVVVVRSGAACHGFYVVRDRDGQEHNVHQSNLMPIENVPLRFRRAAFERYAHVIGEALRAYPGAVTVDTSPMTPESYAQPLRDAIRAKQEHGYKHPLVDDALFAQYADKVKVRIGTGCVTVGGPNDSLHSKRINGTIKPTAACEDIMIDPECVDRVCALLHEKRLTPPPAFVVYGLDDATIASFEARYDVAFVPHENGRVQCHRLVPPMPIKIGL